ncbi:MAG: hypothetical protein ACI8P9_005131 [Parasphingorhabdus sp.]|jgi:hypothetical protein
MKKTISLGVAMLWILICGQVQAVNLDRCDERQVLDNLFSVSNTNDISTSPVYKILRPWAQAAVLKNFKAARKIAPGVVRDLRRMVPDKQTVKRITDIDSVYKLAFVHASISRVSLTDYQLIDAYRHGKRAVSLIQQYRLQRPDDLRADYFLGLFQYYTGAAPLLARWLAKMFGMDGDIDQGIQSLEKVALNSDVLSTEAARVLLFEVLEKHRQPCRYTGLARDLVELYPDNTVFWDKWAREQFRCETANLSPKLSIEPNITVVRSCPAA